MGLLDDPPKVRMTFDEFLYALKMRRDHNRKFERVQRKHEADNGGIKAKNYRENPQSRGIGFGRRKGEAEIS